jgi:iron complex outermembrane recepter protein
MIRYLFALAAIVTPELLCAQQPDSLGLQSRVFDLAEVEVSATPRIGNADVVNFYRPNYFSTIDDLLSRLSGLSMVRRGPYAQEAQLGGFSDGQLNVTIDGMHLFGACTDHMDPVTSYIEPTNLKRISIAKGTQGCESGCTVGGSIDLSLSEPSVGNDDNHTAIGYGYQSISSGHNLLFSTQTSANKWAATLEGVYRNNQPYTNGNGEKVKFSQFNKVNLHTAIKYLAGERSWFKADVLYDDAWDVGYPALPMDVKSAKAFLGAVEYQTNGSIPIKAKLYHNNVNHVMDDNQRDSLVVIDGNNQTADSLYMRMDMPGITQTTGAFANATFNMGSDQSLFVKAEGYRRYALAEMTMYMRPINGLPETPMYMQTWPETERYNAGAYIAWDKTFNHDWLLTVALRTDVYHDVLLSDIGVQQLGVFYADVIASQTNWVKNINITAEHRWGKQLAASASAGYGERAPTISELFGYYLYNAYDGYDYIGNPNLDAEQAVSARLAVYWMGKRFKASLDQTINLITNQILGMANTGIPPLNIGANGVKLYQNTSSSRLYSVDALLAWEMTNALSLINSTKYTYGQFKGSDALPMMPPLKNLAALQYTMHKHSFQVQWETALEQKRINTSFGETQTPGFSVFNAKYGYSATIGGKPLDLSVSLTNLFDAFYHEHLDWGQIPRPGRSVDMFVKYSF